MEKVTPRTLSGFMELLPQSQVRFNKMSACLSESFSLFGYTPLDTPIIESSEVLLAKAGGETEKQIYRFLKGDTDLSLRFDLTVPLAKYVAMNYSRLTFPFRRYQIGKVYRGERAQKGRFREFYQADIDIIGDTSLDIINEAEIPSIIYKCFTSLGLTRFVIRVNNRKLLGGFFELLGLSEQSGDIMRLIDKLDKIGREKVSELLTDEIGVEKAKADEIIGLVTCQENSEDPFDYLEKYLGRSEMFDTGVNELKTVAKYISGFGVPDTHFKIDLTIARGLDYYTGTVYETTVTDHPEIGSVCSGGRYDNLAEHYTDKKLPGVGISIGLTRLFFILEAEGYINPKLFTAPADVLILPMTEDLDPAVKLATQMREAGIRVMLHTENKKFKSKISYADKLKIPFVVFLGEDEIKNGFITVKDLSTGQQTAASAMLLTAGIKEKLASMHNEAPIKEPKRHKETSYGDA